MITCDECKRGIVCDEYKRGIAVIFNDKTGQYHGYCANKKCPYYNISVTHLMVKVR